MKPGNPTVPAEIRDNIDLWAGEHIPDHRIRFAPKTTPRVVAWQLCEWKDWNPWRKMHTQNFWC